jgi:two-component system, OmpR family, sensor histidine kinase KdpD
MDRASARRDRAAALGAADLDLARSAHAAGLDPRRRHQPARPIAATSSRRRRKGELLATIIDESERLNRFIANLLDMTKLESGAITPKRKPHDLGEIIGSALRAPARSWPHTVSSSISRRSADAELDAVLFEQVLFNLLDNAAKYAPPARRSRSRRWRDGLRALQSSTKARHSRPTDLERIFDKFYRVQKGDRSAPAPGSGLPSRAASSKRCTARSSRPTAPTAAARCSPSAADPASETKLEAAA